MTTLHLKKSIGRSSLRLGLHLIPLLLACFALLPSVQATPDPGAVGGGNSNAADGFGALNATVSGINNSGFGANALHNLTTGNNNAAQGNSALFSNTGGNKNTALGVLALRLNLSGDDNTAVGYRALNVNTSDFNTAVGSLALANNTMGAGNTAVGSAALFACTGVNNIALGAGAGSAVTEGSNNIHIGNNGAAEGDTIRIGTAQTACFIAGITAQAATGGVPVVVNSQGKLGTTIASSERFKQEIKPMDKASDAILSLKPVTFRYKQEFDPEGVPQFGLIAEQVEKVNPDLVVRDPKGEVNGVRYEAVNAMLLNEFLKEHRTVEELKSAATKQEATIAELKSTVAQQQKGMESLATGLQKVSEQLELSNPAPQMVGNNR